MNKSLSESNLNVSPPRDLNITPPNYVSNRAAKKRKEDHSPPMHTDTQHEPGNNDISALREEMREMFATLLATQRQEFEKINPTLKQIQDTNIKIESSIEFLSRQNLELQKRIETLELQKKEDAKHITALEDKIENMLKHSRKANFEIKNVPKKEKETKEDLIKMVTCLSSSVGAALTKSDVADIYRVRGKKDNVVNTPIVVETTSTTLKSELLQSCKTYNIRNKTKLRAKHLGFVTQEETPIFVSEQLTPKASRLYFLARDLVKSTTFTFCWTAYGNVYVRRDENSPIITITSEAQIKQLFQIK
ncbi:uncharacterized protein LOC135072784 [Ostrinia nubilalis]|uniref:uncharacterized protein LOC135072784 n=1 Tax=Ostrinia nubilalis TaxID=29057 RepID=UPI00308256E0